MAFLIFNEPIKFELDALLLSVAIDNNTNKWKEIEVAIGDDVLRFPASVLSGYQMNTGLDLRNGKPPTTTIRRI